MKSQACISTIILNWNRVNCLKITVESYLKTIVGPYELVVVDNASSDGSVEYLREIEALGHVRVVYLAENIGGLAYNKVFDLLHGELFHLSENDQLFLPGWAEHTRESFETFDDLGQLSLFADVPTDYEAWGPKPSKLRFKNGKIIYEAHQNLTTSCIMRAELITHRGIRVTNLDGQEVKLPADETLSNDVKAAGFWCAWSDRYYVRNLGHEVEEFESNEQYYRANYSHKGVGVEGWQARLKSYYALPKFKRESATFPNRKPVVEKTDNPVQGKPARLWSMFDTRTPEAETLDFLYALTRLIKPSAAFESNTWLGLTTCAVAKAMHANGFGEITTLENNADVHASALKNIANEGYTSFVKAILANELPFSPEKQFELAIFNADDDLQVRRFLQFREYLKDGSIVVICSAASHFPVTAEGIRALQEQKMIHGVDLPTPRGLFVGRLL